MKKIILIIALTVAVLSACNQAPSRDNQLRPATDTNEAARANLRLGIEYMRRGDYEIALEKLNRARAADAKYSGIYNAFGLLYQQLGRKHDAEKNFKKALKLDPGDSSTMNNYGRFLCQVGRSEEAEKTFLRAAENPLYTTPEIAITNAGTCARKNDRARAAEKYFRQALDIDKTIPTALLQMSQLSLDKANYLSARAYLQRYLAVARPTPASLWLGIRIERKLGDEDALSSYTLSLKNNFPDSRETGLLLESEATR